MCSHVSFLRLKKYIQRQIHSLLLDRIPLSILGVQEIEKWNKILYSPPKRDTRCDIFYGVAWMSKMPIFQISLRGVSTIVSRTGNTCSQFDKDVFLEMSIVHNSLPVVVYLAMIEHMLFWEHLKARTSLLYATFEAKSHWHIHTEVERRFE